MLLSYQPQYLGKVWTFYMYQKIFKGVKESKVANFLSSRVDSYLKGFVVMRRMTWRKLAQNKMTAIYYHITAIVFNIVY